MLLVNARTQLEIGHKFGRWTVLEITRMPPTPKQIRAGRPGNKGTRCRCDCGTVKLVHTAYLVNGRSKSCGCYRAERTAECNRQRADHGLSKHEHWHRWSNMLERCENPQNPKYPRYGGRGIAICEEWHDVRNFIAYLETELGPCPPGYSLDRVDNDGNYEPGNMRWASTSTQNANQSRFLTVGLPVRGPHAKLTADQVSEIRRRYAAGESVAVLARAFGVTGDAISGRVRSAPA